MNILITGGRGYLGRYIVQKLLDQGHTVINYCRDMQLPNEEPRNIFVFGELSDIPRLIQTIEKYHVDRIINTAAQSHPDWSLEVPYATVDANVMGMMGVLEAARLTGVKRVVLFSSECAYGNSDGSPMAENHPLCPTTPYGVTKAANEMMGRAYNKCFGMDIISLRVGQVYGPGQVMQEYIRDAAKAAIDGETYDLENGGDQKIQLVHVTDAAEGVVLACMSEKKNDLAVYNITSGYQPTFYEVLDILKELIPGARFNVGGGDYGGDYNGIFVIEAAKRDLGYIPKVSLRAGLEEYVKYLQEHPW
ncbi:NAD(P)-dependent oxidoreductase [Clostridium sp. AM58-1XD]|uniref:NAD-dependent epimerase/dehydratase family protein n=1 Tax=Clostridium sp. AM58-1XD TaxID=2292307 RepID=UPI000E4CD1F0|nr:NAD(P)-dependent oxidoreductase [Clostridium sp. AM58-1XD]RGZ00684.1 NAD(P)-dependent oxidoreductase [Clostridium sp. AM58-1XD]